VGGVDKIPGERPWTFRREREFFCHKQGTKIQNILNITTVAGYQKGIPIKLVAYSTNNIRSMHNAAIQQNI